MIDCVNLLKPEDAAVNNKRARSITPTTCEHVESILPLDATLLSRNLRFCKLDCVCQNLQKPVQICLLCGKLLCPTHYSSQIHFKDQSHGIFLDIASMNCSCVICDKIVRIENVQESLTASFEDIGRANGLRGLINLGNTCFMNSVWQALSNVQSFRNNIFELVLQQGDQMEPTTPAKGTHNLRERQYHQQVSTPSTFKNWVNLLTSIWRGENDVVFSSRPLRNGDAIDPSFLFKQIINLIPAFGDSSQHDAHEFLRMFSDILQLEQSWINEVFCGSLLSEICCLGCHSVTRKIDPYLDLSLDFPSDMILPVLLRNGEADCPRAIRLHDSLRHFTRLEHISGQNDDDLCKVCNKSNNSNNTGNRTTPHPSITPPVKIDSTKRLRLLTLPKVLVLHFKRFKWSFYYSSTKISRYVQFPLKGLKLKEFMAKDSLGGSFSNDEDVSVVYDLVAVIVHHGRTMGVSKELI